MPFLVIVGILYFVQIYSIIIDKLDTEIAPSNGAIWDDFSE